MTEEEMDKIGGILLWLFAAVLIFLLMIATGVAQAETPPVKGMSVMVPFKIMCTPGYSASVRPSANYTNALKKKLAKKKGVNPSDYELDHLIPIALGGDPVSVDNLWLQSWPDAKKKDVIEANLHRRVCAGLTSVGYAQKEMAAWR